MDALGEVTLGDGAGHFDGALERRADRAHEGRGDEHAQADDHHRAQAAQCERLAARSGCRGFRAIRLGLLQVGVAARVHERINLPGDTVQMVAGQLVLNGTPVPKILFWLVAPFYGYTRDFVWRNMGIPIAFNNARSREGLGIRYRDVREAVCEHFQQLIDDGLVKRR